MKTLPFILTFALAISAVNSYGKSAPEPVAPADRPIDLVICLDTSGSMQGLIEAAKLKLWDIVNELARAKPAPHLRVGLAVYGTPGYGTATGYVKTLVDLTDDLDSVYAQLTPLRTNGGEEYVARVIRASRLDQPWSTARDALKIIVVAGNEPAIQDPRFPVLDTAKDAITAGIIVNTIYCGSPADGIAAGWREVARAADGQFASIDHHGGTIVVATPFDQRLVELSAAINQTYVAYGRRAGQGKENQVAMDAAAMTASPSAAAGRAAAKATGLYRNAGWDLVDARKEDNFNLAKVADEELPAEMLSMTFEQRREYLDGKARERAVIQAEIAQLNEQRQQHIAAELKKTGLNTDQAFEAAMLAAIRAQAGNKAFSFE